MLSLARVLVTPRRALRQSHPTSLRVPPLISRSTVNNSALLARSRVSRRPRATKPVRRPKMRSKRRAVDHDGIRCWLTRRCSALAQFSAVSWQSPLHLLRQRIAVSPPRRCSSSSAISGEWRMVLPTAAITGHQALQGIPRRADRTVPVAGAGLTKLSQSRVPRTVVAVQQPAPVSIKPV